jgi:hypothetical protein
MSFFDPKEIIALAKKERWGTVKNFCMDLIKKTLKKNIPYDLIIQKGKAAGEKIIPTQSIKNVNQLKILDDIEEFKTISFYQSDGIIRNHISISKKEDIIILISKYMAPKLEYEGNFDFAVKLDSKSHPLFTSICQDPLNCEQIIDVINKYFTKSKALDLNNISDEKLENYIFEKISGKNAIWGNSETKAFQEWKERISNLFREETEKNAYYGGSVTKRYRKYLDKMFQIWYKFSIDREKPIESENLKSFMRFLENL